jgi:hypothetical protein
LNYVADTTCHIGARIEAVGMGVAYISGREPKQAGRKSQGQQEAEAQEAEWSSEDQRVRVD